MRRALAFYFAGKIGEAQWDWTQVIDGLPGAPVERIAKALYNRGVTWGKKGDTEKELADYSRVIDGLPGAPAEWIAKALAARGWIYYEQNDFLHFLSDTETSLQKDPSLDFAAFNKGLALLALRRDVDALATYRMAKEQFPSKVDTLGIPDLEDAQKNWLSPERAKPILDLLRAG